MKNLFPIFIFLTYCTCFSQDFIIDHEKPTNVVIAMFHAAQTGQLEILSTLCDPLEEGDGDVKRLCSLGSISDEQIKELEKRGKSLQDIKNSLYSVYGSAAISCCTKYETNEFGTFALVDFYFYPNGKDKEMETMKLVQRGSKWYLYSF
jgi:hypothetical protein